jgi:hypothetical protein
MRFHETSDYRDGRGEPRRVGIRVAIATTDSALCQIKTRDWPGVAEMETPRNKF